MPRHHDNSRSRRSDEENAIGLTQAFSPVSDDDYFSGAIPTDPFEETFDGPRTDADDEGEGTYDDSISDGPADDGSSQDADRAATSPAFDGAEGDGDAPVPPEGESAVTQEEIDEARARRGMRGKHARHAKSSSDAPADGPADARDLGAPTAFEKGGEEVPAYLMKSRRMRRILTVAIIVLLVLLVVGAVLVWQLVQTANTAATQQAQNTPQDVSEVLGGDAATDASTETARTTTVPDLVSLLGMTQDEAVDALQHGAQVSSSHDVNEEGNPIKKDVRIALTAEPADTRSGTPTVYLGLDEDGAVIQAGYSVATSSLGYGSLSFSDAVGNEHIVEKTLQEAGVPVEEGAAVLPEDKADYSTYDSDGTTLTREYCSFSGSVDIDGAAHDWSAALSYDYSMANATGNLADTIRTVYVYVNA